MNGLSTWVIAGTAQNATHLIMVMDHFDYDTYPVYVLPTDNVLDVINKYRFRSMQRIVDVYELSDSRAVKATKSYNTVPASPEQIAIKNDRDRIYAKLKELNSDDNPFFRGVRNGQIHAAIFGEEK